MSADLSVAARQVLGAFGWEAATIAPMKNRENAVFRVALGTATAALRLHRPGYQTPAAIRSELWWCRALAATGFPAPEPVPTLDGALTAQAGDRTASLVRWLPGTPVGIAGEQLSGTPSEQIALFRRIGALAARLHDATDTLALPPGFERPHWDAETLLGDDPRWGRFWANPALSDPESAFLQQTRHAAREALSSLPAPDHGLIHADLMRENILAGEDGLALIDFDDSGFGWRLYDLASALYQNLEEPALPGLATALLSGYTRPLPPGPERALTLALLLRCLASCGWIVTRAAPGDPALRRNADRALRLARLWRDGGSVTG